VLCSVPRILVRVNHRPGKPLQLISRGVVDKLTTIQNPVMLVAGLNDPIVPPENSRLMAKSIPKVWMSILPGRHRAFDEWGKYFVDEFESFWGIYGL
jgi:pimeloyl-ACP methyl ester carboxylesterase